MSGLMIATERQIFDALETSIQTDHAAGNLADLARHYADGAALYEGQGEVDAACFFWTQAYVLALDAGIDALVQAMHAKLDRFGRMG